MNKQNRAAFYVGPEVEKTPAFAKKTLFVVDLQDTTTVDRYARENKVQHISLGAHNSFDASHYTTYFGKTWEDQITYLLDKGYWVTLNYPAHQHKTVLSMLNNGIWQSRLFVPVLSVNVPRLENSSPNLSIKMDDISGNNSPGVWTMHFTEVTDSNRFTDWNEYEFAPVMDAGGKFMDVFETEVEPKETTVTKTVMDDGRSVFHIDVPDDKVESVLAHVKNIMNAPELGLDTTPTTSLRPETEEVTAPVVENVTPTEAAAAYAEGSKVDPLSAEASKKPKAKK